MVFWTPSYAYVLLSELFWTIVLGFFCATDLATLIAAAAAAHDSPEGILLSHREREEKKGKDHAKERRKKGDREKGLEKKNPSLRKLPVFLSLLSLSLCLSLLHWAPEVIIASANPSFITEK